MMTQLSSGRFIAMHVSSKDVTEDSVEALRELCGPMDPELGRHIHPDSLRAQFGVDKTRNAMHCTDLEEDAQLELSYIFQQEHHSVKPGHSQRN